MEFIMSHLDKYNLKIISRGKVSELKLKSEAIKEVEFIIDHWFPTMVSLTPPTSQSSRFLTMSESICAWHNWIESKDAINIFQCKEYPQNKRYPTYNVSTRLSNLLWIVAEFQNYTFHYNYKSKKKKTRLWVCSGKKCFCFFLIQKKDNFLLRNIHMVFSHQNIFNEYECFGFSHTSFKNLLFLIISFLLWHMHKTL